MTRLDVNSPAATDGRQVLQSEKEIGVHGEMMRRVASMIAVGEIRISAHIDKRVVTRLTSQRLDILDGDSSAGIARDAGAARRGWGEIMGAICLEKIECLWVKLA